MSPWLLRGMARRWPKMARHRKWWFRPLYEVGLLSCVLAGMTWLVHPGDVESD
ncbi:MAG TPA: hypothetical protein VM661_04925 [Candidatus Sulfotelmatobacter sp.]|jgi:hypothetical protein|nr:hypothetical protein [Candidatus Sulfotelmatobacter sp.]